MHGLDTSNVSSRVESSRAKWNLSPNRCHNFSLPPVDTRAWASDRQSGHVSHRCHCIRTESLDMCVCSVVSVLSRKFSPFRCLNVTTLFNTDVKVRFRAVATVSCSAAILWYCCGDVYLPSQRAPGISVYILSCNCTA